ncbi:MAG: hypothetical protein ACFFEA_04445, partial [Candidatus Thorarchaeota archaeon]
MAKIELALLNIKGEEKVTRVDSEYVSLSWRNIRAIDLSPLAQQDDLREIHLGENHLESIDLSPLSECSNLRVLDLFGNKL